MQTGRISRLSYDELGPGERGVVVLDGVGGAVPHQDVEGLVHAAVEARDALHVEGVRGLVDHRAVLHRLGGNWKYTSVTCELCKVESTMCCFYYYWKQFYTQKENNTFLLPRLIGKFLDTSRHYRLSTTCSVFCCWYAQQLREFATEAARACLLSNALNIHFEKRSIMQTEVWRWRGEGGRAWAITDYPYNYFCLPNQKPAIYWCAALCRDRRYINIECLSL